MTLLGRDQNLHQAEVSGLIRAPDGREADWLFCRFKGPGIVGYGPHRPHLPTADILRQLQLVPEHATEPRLIEPQSHSCFGEGISVGDDGGGADMARDIEEDADLRLQIFTIDNP